MNINELVKKLEVSKRNVKELLDNSDALIDMKGLSYWAGVVEQLREKIKELI